MATKARFRLYKQYDKADRCWYVGIESNDTGKLVELPEGLAGGTGVATLDSSKAFLSDTVAKVREAMAVMEHDADAAIGLGWTEHDAALAADELNVDDESVESDAQIEAENTARENVGETSEAESAWVAAENANAAAAAAADDAAFEAQADGPYINPEGDYRGDGDEVEDEHEASYEDETDDSKLVTLATDEELAAESAAGQAWFVGTYKGATYRAVQLEDGAFAVPSLSIEDEEVDATLTGERFKSLSNAGHAVAAFVLARLGLENKTPPARATFKLVSGTVAERVKATSKGSKARALRIFKRSPVNHVPAGSSRWFCSACMASFVVEGDSEPERCDNGHTAADFAEVKA